MMKMYWVSSYFLKENKSREFQQWLLSVEATALFAEIEKETGMRYMETFWPILGFGEYDVEDWFECPNWASLDSIRDSKAMDTLITRTDELGFFDGTRPQSTRMMRSTREVKIMEPARKKEKEKEKKNKK
jgi:hypothetical protein